MKPNRLKTQPKINGTVTHSSMNDSVKIMLVIRTTLRANPSRIPTRAAHPDTSFNSRSCMAWLLFACYHYDITLIANGKRLFVDGEGKFLIRGCGQENGARDQLICRKELRILAPGSGHPLE